LVENEFWGKPLDFPAAIVVAEIWTVAQHVTSRLPLQAT